MKIEIYNKKWPKIFQVEKKLLNSLFGEKFLDIQHIGSTSIPLLSAKPIIDIAVSVYSIAEAIVFIATLNSIGYEFSPEKSSVERLFFVKYGVDKFHLSLTQVNKFSYWQRQIFFREYLINHPKEAQEYQKLKLELIKKYPDARQEYSDGKNEFVQKILKLAHKK